MAIFLKMLKRNISYLSAMDKFVDIFLLFTENFANSVKKNFFGTKLAT